MSEETNDKPVVDEKDTKEEETKEDSDDEKDSSMEVEEEKDEKTEEKDNKDEKVKTEGKTKKKEETKEESEDEDEEDDEPQIGSLERPVVLEEGKKRERKKVERMSFKSPEVEEKKFGVEEGRGTPLGDIPFIEFKVGRTKAEDLKVLHRLLFKRVGTLHEIKKNIRKFSGFPFSKDDAEFEKRTNNLKGKSFTIPMVKSVCELLDVPRSGTKDEICDRLMDWLAEPSDSGRKVPAKKRKKETKGKKGKKKRSAPKKQEKKEKSKSKDSDDDDDDDDDDEEEEEDESDKEEASDSDESVEEPPKKKAKKATPKPKEKKVKEKKPTPKPKKTPTPKKKTTPTKKKAKAPASDEEVSDISSDSDDEPLVAKVKAPPKAPTNEELKDVIKKMLDSANLEEVTMKTILKDVFSKYPTFDLSDRKDFIKNTVKQIIS